MGCLKLSILDEQYKTEQNVSSHKELTPFFYVKNERRVLLYAYCNNNPLRWIDPTGMSPEDPSDGNGDGSGTPPPKTPPPPKPETKETPKPEVKPMETTPTSTSGNIMMGTLAICGVLAADDITVIGVADDIAIPVVFAVGCFVAGAVKLYESLTNSSKSEMSQHGTNNNRLGSQEVAKLRAKQEAGTLTSSEAQKLKAHEKATGERHSRHSKDKK